MKKLKKILAQIFQFFFKLIKNSKKSYVNEINEYTIICDSQLTCNNRGTCKSNDRISE